MLEKLVHLESLDELVHLLPIRLGAEHWEERGGAGRLVALFSVCSRLRDQVWYTEHKCSYARGSWRETKTRPPTDGRALLTCSGPTLDIAGCSAADTVRPELWGR